MNMMCYAFVAFLSYLAVVSFAQQPKIDLLKAAGLTASTNLPSNSGVTLLVDEKGNSAGYTSLNTPAFHLEAGRSHKIRFSSTAAQDIGSNLQLSASKKFFSFYTMLRLDVIKARDPAFLQTQTLLDLEDSQNSQTYFKIGLKIKAKQTLACLTCVQINLVVNYKTGGGPSKEVVLPEDYSQDLNNGQWHNLFVGFVYGVAGSDSTGGKTEIFPKIDCVSKTQQSIADDTIGQPTNAEVILGGEGDKAFIGSIQDLYFVEAAYLSVEVEALAKYCRENSCGVDCKDSVAPFEARLSSLRASNDKLANDITSCEAKPTVGPMSTVTQRCIPETESKTGGSCKQCRCDDDGQKKCYIYSC